MNATTYKCHSHSFTRGFVKTFVPSFSEIKTEPERVLISTNASPTVPPRMLKPNATIILENCS